MNEEAKLALLRQDMVQNQLRSRGIRNQDILDAFAEVPREWFVPPEYVHEVYEDHPVPIGLGQTISQPYVVALMVQELRVGPRHRVLEIGAGSGYVTAILARLAAHVHAIERLPELTERAIAAVARTGATNVTLLTGDGSMGWPEEAPFDRITCSAAAPNVPQAWLDQLAPGGRIVAPVGGEDVQTLVAIDNLPGSPRRQAICEVRFVRLIGRCGWQD